MKKLKEKTESNKNYCEWNCKTQKKKTLATHICHECGISLCDKCSFDESIENHYGEDR